MAQVLFFEKPGCINNAKQKRILRNAGHNVIAMDMLEYPWSEKLLLDYLSSLPLIEWFNQSAPKVKSGKICPDSLMVEDALKLLVKEPVLIRRPLMKVNNEFKVGFDYDEINNWIGLQEIFAENDLESCPRLK